MSNLLKYKSIIARKVVSPSMRFEINQMFAWIREQLNRACVWRWGIVWLPQQQDSPYSFLYIGRKGHLELSRIIMGIANTINGSRVNEKRSGRNILVSEMPLPGALRIPHYVRAIVRLGRPVEEIMDTYDDKLRRSLLKQRMRYRVKQALSDAEIEFADREMLNPFAKARHGSSANLISSEKIRSSALEYGRLDLLLLDGEIVACMLGNASIRKGKRYWIADRCGYPESVYSDPKRLGETNSINHHFAIENSINNGFDYCDFALCFARPDDGLLQFKRRRGAELDTIGLKGYGHFYVRLPKTGTAQFLWNTPLFAVERKKLTLHLGLPNGTSDDEFVTRYRQMGFGGLSKIYLHCARPPGKHLLTTLYSFYRHQNSSPLLESIAST